MHDPWVRRLHAILDAEHVAILAGDFDSLNAQSTEKEALLARRPGVMAEQDELSAIARKVSRNQSLIAASLRGVRTAQVALQDAQNIAEGSKVYGRNGEVSRLSGKSGDFSHRA